MDKEKLHQINQDTNHLRNIESLSDITSSMVHRHVEAENKRFELVADTLTRHIEEGNRIWLSFEKKLDLIFNKLDNNAKMTHEALNLAREIDGIVKNIIPRVKSLEDKQLEDDILKREIKLVMRIIVIIFSAVTFVIPTFYYFYINHIKSQTEEETISRLQNSNVQVQEIAPNSGIFKIKILQ